MPVPTREDWRTMAKQFAWRWNFPNAIGAIDGEHVVMQAPSNSCSLYYNEKGTFSLVLVAIVDPNYFFQVMDVGGYGRTCDSGSLRNSSFREHLWDGNLHIPPDCAISGAEQYSIGRLPTARVRFSSIFNCPAAGRLVYIAMCFQGLYHKGDFIGQSASR